MGLVPMGAITGDHRSVLVKESSKPKVSFAARQNDARKMPKTGHATGHSTTVAVQPGLMWPNPDQKAALLEIMLAPPRRANSRLHVI